MPKSLVLIAFTIFLCPFAIANLFNISVDNESDNVGEIFFITPVPHDFRNCSMLKHERKDTQAMPANTNGYLLFKTKSDERELRTCLAILDPFSLLILIYEPVVLLRNASQLTLIDRIWGTTPCIELEGQMLPDQGFCNAHWTSAETKGTKQP